MRQFADDPDDDGDNVDQDYDSTETDRPDDNDDWDDNDPEHDDGWDQDYDPMWHDHDPVVDCVECGMPVCGGCGNCHTFECGLNPDNHPEDFQSDTIQ
jgi:hypothetical protein